MVSLAGRSAAQSVAAIRSEPAQSGESARLAADGEPGLKDADSVPDAGVTANRWRSLVTHGAVAVTGAAVVLVGGWLGGFTLAAGPAAVPWTPSTTAASDGTGRDESGVRPESEAGEQPAAAEEVTAALDTGSSDTRRGVPADDRPASSARPGAAPAAAQSTTTTSNTTNSTSVATNPTTAAQQNAAPMPTTANSSSAPEQILAPASALAPAPASAPDPEPEPIPTSEPEPIPTSEPEPAAASEPISDPVVSAPGPEPAAASEPIPDPVVSAPEPEPTIDPSQPALA